MSYLMNVTTTTIITTPPPTTTTATEGAFICDSKLCFRVNDGFSQKSEAVL